MTPPVFETTDRTALQRKTALAKANATRAGKRQLKDNLRAGNLTIFAALDSEWASRMTVEELLLATPRVGPVTTRRLCCRLGLSPSKRVGGLTERQLSVLTAALRETT